MYYFFCSINTFFFSVHLVSLDSQASSMNTWNFSQILGYLQQHEHTGNIKNLPYSIFEKEVRVLQCNLLSCQILKMKIVASGEWMVIPESIGNTYEVQSEANICL